MQGHELTMRQMVEEVHRGNLNIDQAAARFEVNRKTVKHWLDKVESEATVLEEQVGNEPARLKKKPSRPRAAEQPNARVEELMAKVHSLEQDLEAARFKALYYSTLVRVAEQELGIDIEKSPLPSNPIYAGQIPSYAHSTGRGITWVYSTRLSSVLATTSGSSK